MKPPLPLALAKVKAIYSFSWCFYAPSTEPIVNVPTEGVPACPTTAEAPMILACYIATLYSKYGLFDNEAIPAKVPKLVVTGAFHIFSNADYV